MFPKPKPALTPNTEPHPAPIFDTGPHPGPLRPLGFTALDTLDPDAFLHPVNGHAEPVAVPAKPAAAPAPFAHVRRWQFVFIVAAVWVLAAAAGQILRVYGMMLVWTSASNVQINQSTSAFTGTMSMLAGSSMMLTPNTRPYFVCDSGNPFRINSSTTASVTGCVWYRSDPAP